MKKKLLKYLINGTERIYIFMFLDIYCIVIIQIQNILNNNTSS